MKPEIKAVAIYVVRTALENRMLQAELPGYGPVYDGRANG